jgi:CDP-diacylglycerol--glycerol-3-phosphate 3-phosphatidyltransferase
MRIPKSLGMYWWTTALISFCAVIVFNLLLSFHWQIPFDWTRFVVPLLPLIYVLAVLRSGLPLNHRPGETQVLAHLGMANGITMVRGVLVSVLACFWNWPATIPFSIHHSFAWLPGVIYITAALLDLVDGIVARHTDRVTRLGERLDTLFDALGLLTAVLAGIALNQLPLSYLAVALAYYVFSAEIRVRRRTGRLVIPLKPRPAARLVAGFNMGFLATALLPIYRPPATTIAAMVFMVPFLAGFLRDWLVVSGRIKTGSSQPAPWEEKWRCLFRERLPVVLRAVLLLSSYGPGKDGRLLQRKRRGSVLYLRADCAIDSFAVGCHGLSRRNGAPGGIADPAAEWSLDQPSGKRSNLVPAHGCCGRLVDLRLRESVLVATGRKISGNDGSAHILSFIFSIDVLLSSWRWAAFLL